MLAILKRELRAYFYTPTAYVFLTVFFIFFSMFFMLTNVFSRGNMYQIVPATANFGYTVSSMILIMLFILPVLVMRLISEERKQKTDQLLHTSPISTVEIVIAKYFSALAVFSVGMLISLIYPIVITIVSGASMKYLIAVYLGFFLVGASFIAICLFASSLTESQVFAGFMGFSFILVLWLMEFIGSVVKSETVKSVINWISLLRRFDDFTSGLIKLAPVVFYLSVIILFIFLTVRTIEKRRWTEG